MTDRNSKYNKNTVEQLINNYNSGWERLFPENPELEEIFMR
jgi:hypothetical protein